MHPQAISLEGMRDVEGTFTWQCCKVKSLVCLIRLKRIISMRFRLCFSHLPNFKDFPKFNQPFAASQLHHPFCKARCLIPFMETCLVAAQVWYKQVLHGIWRQNDLTKVLMHLQTSRRVREEMISSLSRRCREHVHGMCIVHPSFCASLMPSLAVCPKKT